MDGFRFVSLRHATDVATGIRQHFKIIAPAGRSDSEPRSRQSIALSFSRVSPATGPFQNEGFYVSRSAIQIRPESKNVALDKDAIGLVCVGVASIMRS